MAGTLSYRLNVTHIYQRRFDSESFAEALASSHWYVITRRPSTKIVNGSVQLQDQILTADFETRAELDSAIKRHTFGSDFRHLGELCDFQTHSRGAYFSMRTDDNLFHGDAWALASLLSGASLEIAGQEVLYIGQAFGTHGERNAWQRTQNHKKLQRIYEDHVDSDCEIFVAPLHLDHSTMMGDDHIDDAEEGPDLMAYYEIFAQMDGRAKKPVIDLIEHSLISYFNPPYNEKLTEWRATSPTDAMRKMRSSGFRLLTVHLSGWEGLARFYSAQAPQLIRSHFISQDIPPEPRRPVLRGIAAERLSDWRFSATLAREGNDLFAARAESSGTALRVFGDQAPDIRKPPAVKLTREIKDEPDRQGSLSSETAGHEKIRAAIADARERERKRTEVKKYSGKSSYDPTTGDITVGEYQDGQPVKWRLNDPVSGSVDSAIIIGDPETGKSNHLQLAMFQAAQSGRFFVMPSDPSDRNNIRPTWRKICEDPFIATSMSQTIANLDAARRMIRARGAHENYFNKPTKEVPGILLGIDDADGVLKDPQGARLVGEILSNRGEVGIGLLLVISDIHALKSNTALMRCLVDCENGFASMPNGYWELEHLRALYSRPRPGTLREDCTSFVLHHQQRDATLGIVVAGMAYEFPEATVMSWCANQLARQGIDLFNWEPIDNEVRSYWAMDGLRGTSWLLRQHSDAWALIRVISNTSRVNAVESLEWAHEVMDARFSARCTRWQLGPTTYGRMGTTFYCDVEGELVAKDQSKLIQELMLKLH